MDEVLLKRLRKRIILSAPTPEKEGAALNKNFFFLYKSPLLPLFQSGRPSKQLSLLKHRAV